MNAANGERVKLAPLAIACGLCTWGAVKCGPLMLGGEVQLIPAALSTFAVLTGGKLLGEAVMHLASFLDWLSAHKGSGRSGSAGWAKYKDINEELGKQDAGPFWGMTAKGGNKLFIDFISNAVVVGPAGSGKGHTEVVPLILLMRDSFITVDYKPENYFICKKGLEKRGFKVIALDPFQMLPGETTHSLNALDATTDNLFTPGGLRRVFSDADELSMQLYPDPPGGKGGDDQYWRGGARKIIVLVSVSIAMMHGREGTLADVALLLDDPAALERHLCSIVGVTPDGEPDPQGPYLFEMAEWSDHHDVKELKQFLKVFRAKASGLLKQMREAEKTFSSFFEGAQQAVSRYGYGEISRCLGSTSFDFDAIKNGTEKLAIFVICNASKTKASNDFINLTQWKMQLKLKRHPNIKVPVYLIYDEINNYSPYGYIELLSWGRGFGIRTINILQNFTAFEEKHGKNAVEMLLSESEIKLFLPGQSSIPTIKKVIELLGKQSVMAASVSVNKDKSGVSENMSEAGRELMTEDEVRRSRYGILIVRKLKPILQQPVSYSQIHPLRELAGINPSYGKPFLNKVKLKLELPPPPRANSV